MSFGDYEFPHTAFYNSDLRELISMYKKLTAEYNTIKNEIDEAIQFIRDFDIIVDVKVKAQVEKSIEDLTKNVYAELRKMDSKIIQLAKLVDDNSTKVDEMDMNVKELQAEFLSLRRYVQEELRSIEHEFANIYNYLIEYKASIDARLLSEFERMQIYIDEHVARLDRLYVVSPFTLKLENIQKVIDDIAERLSLLSLTAEQFDSLELTAEQYDRFMMTAFEFDSRSILRFWERLYDIRTNPFTGQLDVDGNIVEMICDYIRQCYSAEEWDALELSAEDFDAILCTAYDYDWRLKPSQEHPEDIDTLKRRLRNVVEVKPFMAGLTWEQMSKLDELGEI